MTNYKSYQLLAYYNHFGAKQSTILEEILARGELDFQIPSDGLYEGKSLKGYTALHIALKRADYYIFEVLIKSGADFTIKNAKGDTVIHLAAKNLEDQVKSKKFIDLVLSTHVSSNVMTNPRDNDGLSHFHAACMSDHVEAVEFFLKNGVSIDEAVSLNSKNYPGYTGLHFAAKYSCVEITKILLNYGANINLKEARGITPLHLLIQRNMEIVDLKITRKQNLWNKFTLEIEKNEQIINLFLDKYSMESDVILEDINLTNLHVICTFQDTSRVKQLLQKGVNLEQRIAANSTLWPGYTPLHFAAHFNPETVILLLENKANFLVKDTFGLTPLDLCLPRYRVEYLYRFINLDPTLKNVRFNDGITRFSDAVFAMANGTTLSCFINNLMSLNMTLESPICNGYTLLHLAVSLPVDSAKNLNCNESNKFDEQYKYFIMRENIFLDRIKICLNRGINIDIRDVQNSTAIHLAFKLKKNIAVDYLLSDRSLVDSVNSENLSCLHIACAADNENAVKRLLWKSVDNVNCAVAIKYKYWTSRKEIVIKSLSADNVNRADVTEDKNHTTYKQKCFEITVTAGSTPLNIAVFTRNAKIAKLLLHHGANIYARDANGMTPIHHLLLQGLRGYEKCSYFREIMNTLLYLDDDLSECKTNFGLSHLHVASYANNVTAIEKLLKNGADIEETIYSRDLIDGELQVLKTIDKFTPLHLALKYDCKDAIVALIRCGANILTVPAKIGCDLYEKHSDFLATTLINELMSQEKIRQKLGLTWLHAACATLHVDEAKIYLEQGMDPNSQLRKKSPLWAGFSPLHFLMIKRDKYPMRSIVSIMELLLAHGADVTLIDSTNNSCLLKAFYRAQESREARIFEFPSRLLRNHHNFKINPVNNDGWSHFHVACYFNKPDIVKKFIKSGVNVNQPIDYMCHIYGGWYPLHLAEHRECEETQDLLREFGAFIYVRNLEGRIPYQESRDPKYSYPNYESSFMSLLKKNDVWNAVTTKGESIFEIILKSRRITSEILKDNHEGSINIFNPITEEGYIAMGLSHETCLSLIHNNLIYKALMKNPENHIPDMMNRTPIHNVVSIQKSRTDFEVYVKVIELFVASNVCIDHQDLNGRTALHCAMKFRNRKAVQALLSLGADINLMDINHETPLSYLWNCCSNPKFSFKALNHGNRLLFSVILVHFYKLRQTGMHISKVNYNIEKLIREQAVLSPLDEKQLEAKVEKLKTKRVDSLKITLFDFLNETIVIPAYPNMLPWKRQIIDNYFEDNIVSLRKTFSEYFGLLQLQYRKAINRSSLLAAAKNSFNIFIDYKLPDLCCNRILMYLNSEDLENLIKLEIPRLQKCDTSSIIENAQWICRDRDFSGIEHEEAANIARLTKEVALRAKITKILLFIDFVLFSLIIYLFVCHEFLKSP